MDNLYAAEGPIIERLSDRLKASLGLREVYGDERVEDLTAETVLTPSIVVASAAFLLGESPECGGVVLRPRIAVAAVDRAYNDRGRADRARDSVGAMCVAIIRSLCGWTPAPGLRPLVLQSIPRRLTGGGKVIAPLIFTTFAMIDTEES